MDGYRVMTALEAAEIGDLFITATGSLHVFGRDHFRVMRDGAILANAGHFNDEFDLPALDDLAAEQRDVRPSTREFRLADGRRLYVLAEGRLVNLAAAEGHPSLVMDLSFANQALGVEWMSQHHEELTPQVYEIPLEIDREVARLKLATMGIAIDRPTAEQEAYAASWQQGT
jgi:adenosylhomocysteinase